MARQAAVHTTRSVARNGRIRFILALFGITASFAQDPPANLARRVTQRETETAQAQSNYTYRQTVNIDELDKTGFKVGGYQEVRDIVFSPAQERSERMIGKPFDGLNHLKLTEQDFRDIREIQPFLMTKDQAFMYETAFRGEETVDGVDCYVLQIRPRQILDGQRLFDGIAWVSKADYSIIRSEGQAVPQIRTKKEENLFPHFTTVRQKMEGGFWFPVTTYGDDILYFRTGEQRIRMIIRYSDYKKFGSESKITFDK